jgi:hypothetical protein
VGWRCELHSTTRSGTTRCKGLAGIVMRGGEPVDREPLIRAVLPSAIPMPIPNATEATAATEKVRDYLLNAEHPDGGSKAAWFQSLGYGRDRWHELASDLLALAATCEQFATVRTPFGVKYVVKGQVGRESHRSASVLAVWIVEADRPPRLVTAYPDEEP